MSDEAKVKLSADTSDVESAVPAAADVISEALKALQGVAEQLVVQFTAVTAATAAMAEQLQNLNAGTAATEAMRQQLQALEGAGTSAGTATGALAEGADTLTADATAASDATAKLAADTAALGTAADSAVASTADLSTEVGALSTAAAGANTANAQLSEGAASTAQATAGATSATKESNEEHGKTPAVLEASLGSMLKTRVGTLAMGAAIGLVAGAVMELTSRLIDLAREALNNAIFKYRDATEESRQLAQALGINMNAASALRGTLDDAGMSLEQFTQISKAMTLRLRENETRFNDLGVVTRDTNGALLDTQQIFFNVLGVIKGHKQGTDQQLVSTELLGRGIKDLGKALELNQAMVDEGRKTLEDFGAVMGDLDKKTAKEFKLTLNDLDDAFEAMYITLGRMITPILNDVAQLMREVLPYAFSVVRYSLATVISVFYAFGLVISEVWSLIKAFVYSVAEPIRALAQAMWQVLTGDFAGAKETLTALPRNMVNAWSNSFDEMADKAKFFRDRIANLWSPDTSAADPEGGKDYQGKPKRGAKDRAARPPKEESYFSEWRAELQRMKDESDLFQGMDLDAEKAFWAEKLLLAQMGAKDYASVQHELAELNRKGAKDELQRAVEILNAQIQLADQDFQAKLSASEAKLALLEATAGRETAAYRAAELEKTMILREEEERRKQVAQQRLQFEQTIRSMEIGALRSRLEFEAQMGAVSGAERLQRERAIAEEQYTLQMEILARRLELEKSGTQAYEAILRERAILERNYAEQQLKFDNQRLLNLKGQIQTVMDAAISGVSNSIKGVVMGTQTLGQAVRNFFQTVGLSMIDLGVKMAAQWALNAAMSKMIEKTSALSAISSHAAQAAAGAYAATAAIPFVGPALAPAAAASAYGATMAWAGTLASAEHGFDIPAGMNPVTQLHEKEMVLPSEDADTLRSMRGGRFGGGTNVYINAVDGKSVERVLEDNVDRLQRFGHKVMRGGRFRRN